MSRLSAYLGPTTSLTPLLALSRPAPEAGFCCGWMAPDGLPAAFETPIALDVDPHLPDLARGLSSHLWLTLARAADERATRPTYDQELLLLPAGGEGLESELRASLSRHLAPVAEMRLARFTLGEYLLALLRQLLDDDEELSLDAALLEMLNLTTRMAGEKPLDLNLALSDGERIYLVRHAANRPCAPIHYSTDDERFPDAQVAASEAPRDSEFWLSVPESHLLILDPDEPPELIAL